LRTNTKIHLASALRKFLACIPGYRSSDQPVYVKRSGLNWSLDLDEGIDLSVFLFGSFEPKTIRVLRELISEGDRVFDIGANVGTHTLFIASFCGNSGHVYSFEPTDYAFRKLLENLRLNPEISARVSSYRQMMGKNPDESVPKSIFSSWPVVSEKEVDPVFGGVSRSTEGAEMNSLDNFCFSQGENISPDFLKIDVDGFERDVLDGAVQTLKKSKPKIMIEYMPSGIKGAGWSASEFLGFFDEHGYDVLGYDLSRPVTLKQLDEVKFGSGLNLFCISRS
jgi:FkbM family methyltransferase